MRRLTDFQLLRGLRRAAGSPIFALLAFGLLLGPGDRAFAQSSQAVLQGRIIEERGDPIPAALVLLRNIQTNATSYRYTNSQGLYYFSAVFPGTYSVRVDSLGYTPQERPLVEVSVGSTIEVDFALVGSGTLPPSPAPLRLGENPRRILAIMYGADSAIPEAMLIEFPLSLTDRLVGSISRLIDERQVQALAPVLELGGRDLYHLLLLQPGFTSEQATAWGLASTVNGQLTTSSNFLLDGVDNNDLVSSGAATRVSTEALKEFRIITNSYSAEYGRASGFIASAVTRSGTNAFHGTLFESFKHESLSANSFANNWQHLPRPPFREHQYGGSLGGPLQLDRLFFFGSFERLPTFSQSQPFTVFLPSPLFVASLPQGSVAAEVLRRFPPPEGGPLPADHPYAPYVVSRDVVLPSLQRDTLGLGRLDYTSLDGRHRLGARYSVSQTTLDDFYFSIYPDLNAPLVNRGQNVSVNYTRDVFGGSNVFNFGFNRKSVEALRPHPEIPAFTTGDGITLAGSDAAFDYSVQGTVFHLANHFSFLRGAHALGLGAEWRPALYDSLFTPGRDGFYSLDSVFDYFFDDPTILQIAINLQTGLPATDADFRRSYFQNEGAVFFQDNWKLTPRLTLNLGLRWEYFGAPSARKNTQDYNFVFGPGSDVGERIAAGRIETGPLFRPDRNNFAPRFGFAFDLFGSGRSVLRGGYGIFYDRVHNGLWVDAVSNSFTLQALINIPNRPPQFQLSLPASDGVFPVSRPLPGATFSVDGSLRTPYSQNWFLGLQQELTPEVVLEANLVGSLGRKLVTADLINRAFSVPFTERRNGRYNPDFGDMSYRGNQGHSDHLALQVSLRQHASRNVQFDLAYTFSRTRDIQSDLLVGEGLSTPSAAASNLSSDAFFLVKNGFTRQFDPSADYGHSDFDQTHNLVASVVAQSPALPSWASLLSGWRVAALAGFRSGFPFSVHTGSSCPAPDTPVAQCRSFFFPESGGFLARNRADFIGESYDEAFLDSRPEVPGGVLLLDETKFRPPVGDNIGNLPRNAFRGPGFWNMDLALSRAFTLPKLPERFSAQFHLEFLNVLNHTNLNNPFPVLESPAFGAATFGRQGVGSSVLGVQPLDEQPRRIQVGLKFLF